MMTVFYRYPPTHEGSLPALSRAERIKAIEEQKRIEGKVKEIEEEGMDLVD